MTLLISNDDVLAAVGIGDCISAIESVYRAASRSRAASEPRSVFWSPLGQGRRHALATLQGVGLDEGIAAIRIRSDVYSTVRTDAGLRDEKFAGSPGSFCGLVLLFDTLTGVPVAIANDGILQQMRVAATAAVAAKHLAAPHSRRLAVIGAGNQARWHARALAAAFDLESISVHSPSPQRRESLARDLGDELDLPVVAVESPAAAVDSAALVAVCTNSLQPVIDASLIPDGAFVSSVRHRAEMGPSILERAGVVVVNETDERDELRLGTAEEQADSGLAAPRQQRSAQRRPSLAELVGGEFSPRIADSDVRYFMNNQGAGIQFVAVGALALRAVQERGGGQELPTEWFLQSTSS